MLAILRREYLVEAKGRRQELAAQRARESQGWWAGDAESAEQKARRGKGIMQMRTVALFGARRRTGARFRCSIVKFMEYCRGVVSLTHFVRIVDESQKLMVAGG